MNSRAILLAIGILTAAGEAMSIEQLAYRTIEQGGGFELRLIPPHAVAETAPMDACFVAGKRVAPQAGGCCGGWITSDILGPFEGGLGTNGW